MTDRPKVRRQDGRVWIDNVAKPPWGNWQENSVMACLSVVLPVLGEEGISYEYLMGLSGAAFRIQVMQPGWCPSSPHANCGFNCTDAVMKALGHPLISYTADEGDAEAEETRRKALVESIDRGRPALHQPEECGIIVGYEDEGKRFLHRRYQSLDDDYEILQEFGRDPGSADVIGDKQDTPPRREALIQSLERVVSLAKTSMQKAYASGFNAYDRWIAGLRDDENENVRNGNIMGNGWIYCCLQDARKCAGGYLRSIAGEFDRPAAQHLATAADLYGQVHDKIGVPCEIAPGPWALTDAAEWTPDMRQRQAEILTDAFALEREAVAEIERALAVIE